MGYDAGPMAKVKAFDVAVVGAGVFGSWIALHLARREQRVIVLDAYGPANSRASSGGESRIIRMGYGPDELYTRWARRSLVQWKELFGSCSPALFHETGVLWLASHGAAPLAEMKAVLKRCDVPFEALDNRAMAQRYPQFSPQNLAGGVLETGGGVLMGRRAVAAVLERAVSHGVEYRAAQVAPPLIDSGDSTLSTVMAAGGEEISAGQFVFACGAWLGKVFPELLAPRIFPSRQEVFFFGVPSGDDSFGAAALPTWLIPAEETYGMPDLESRGFKIAFDGHGGRVDPDTQHRVVSAESTERVRSYVAKRFPALRDAPVVETRVCQYENTSNGDFLIDRHPQMSNVWFAGGGSGHGFKHGPMVGEYVTQQLLDGGEAEPRFALANKATQQKRAVY
jgi:sarcosine oxidase